MGALELQSNYTNNINLILLNNYRLEYLNKQLQNQMIKKNDKSNFIFIYVTQS